MRVQCRIKGKLSDVPAGRTLRIPFGERNSCRGVIDLETIPKRAGEQRLHVKAGSLDRVLRVAHRVGTIAFSIPTKGRKEFETVTVAIGHDYGGGHYDFSPQEDLGAEARYNVILGDRRFRVTASTSLPTGLFRFGGKDDRGAVPLSAGGIARLVWLSNEGREFPIGWEVGLLGTGLSDEPDFSVVTGLGFSVPVLNPDTALQTSFNLHAWIEYSPTRTAEGEHAFAFLFGPSFSVGRFSANL